MHLRLLLLLPLALASAPPRLLRRCPAEFATVLEPLPARVGDPVLMTGPRVRLRTLRYLRDPVLLVEPGRLVLNESVDAVLGPFSGPHVLLCSEADKPLATFSLYLQRPVQSSDAAAAVASLRSFAVPAASSSNLLAVALGVAVGIAAALAVALCAALVLAVRRRRRRQVRDAAASGRYRDFRHLIHLYPQAQKLTQRV